MSVASVSEQERLVVAFARAEKSRRLRALLLTVPVLVFLGIFFFYPIAGMLVRSFYDPVVSDLLPRTATAMEDWNRDADDLPPEHVYQAFVTDIAVGKANRTVGRVATRINYALPGSRSAITAAARKAELLFEFDDAKQIISEDIPPPDKTWRHWVEEQKTVYKRREFWLAVERATTVFSTKQYLAAVDRRVNKNEEIVLVPEDRRIYVTLFIRTVWISLLVTGVCLLLGFPVAYFISTRKSPAVKTACMVMVVLPFATSLLVRTTSWIVLLQTQGVLNDIMVALGILNDDGRVQLIYNQLGTVIAMTHILLPFMVLPIYSVMNNISREYVRAARSLGAGPFRAFWSVYAPNTMPGVAAGALLVLILAIGYYITPALVGGQSGQMISSVIAFHIQKSLNWGLAAALGSILLFLILIFYVLYSRVLGTNRLAVA